MLGPHGCYLDLCPRNHEQNGGINSLSTRNRAAAAAAAAWASGAGGVRVVDDPFPSSVGQC